MLSNLMTAIISHIACDVALYKMALTSTVYCFFRDMNVLGAELHFQNRENFEEVLIEILIKNLKIKYFLCMCLRILTLLSKLAIKSSATSSWYF